MKTWMLMLLAVLMLPAAGAAAQTPAQTPPERMPSYPERVGSDEELGHIHAYLQSRPMLPPIESIPLLQPQARGMPATVS